MARTPLPLPPARPDRARPKRHHHWHRTAHRRLSALAALLLWARVALTSGLLFVRFLLAASGGGP